jgi:hypothetical protein
MRKGIRVPTAYLELKLTTQLAERTTGTLEDLTSPKSSWPCHFPPANLRLSSVRSLTTSFGVGGDVVLALRAWAFADIRSWAEDIVDDVEGKVVFNHSKTKLWALDFAKKWGKMSWGMKGTRRRCLG